MDLISYQNKRMVSFDSSQLFEFLLSLGIPPNMQGYRYILYSLELIISDQEYMYSITKGLYIDVAAKFKTTPSNVEHSMRHAIKTAWTYRENTKMRTIFNEKNGGSMPSNSRFLATVYYYILYQMAS